MLHDDAVKGQFLFAGTERFENGGKRMTTGIIREKKKRPCWLWLTGALFLSVVFILLMRNFTSGSVDPLTVEKRTWLKAHPVIRLAPDPDFPPVEYFDKNGGYNGITKDYVSLIEKKLGVRFKIVRLRDWNEIIKKAKSREIDIYVATKTPQRAEYMLFTKPFLEFPVVIIARKKVKGPLNLEKMNGMKVSVVSEYAAHNFIAYNYPKLNLDLVPDVETGLRKVSFGLSDAFVENLATATYYIEKEGITNLRIAGESGFFYRMGFASRNDLPELNQILEKGLADISVDEKKAIYKKWIPVEPISLLASKEFQAAIFSAFGVAVLVITAIVLWNRALARQVGRRTEELEKELAERKRMEEELRHAHEELEKRVEERTTDLRNANGLLEREITVRKRTESVIMARLRLLQFAGNHSLDELLEATLDEAESLTGSLIGFYHFLEDDQKTLSLQNWSTRTKAEFCKAEGKGSHYDVSAAGVWVDCIHERRPVVHNDYASLPHRKGIPPEHPPVVRELVVPVFRGNKIVAILGVGNKPLDYTSEDVETVSLLADLAWEITERKRMEEELLLSHFCINKAAIGIFQISLDDGKILRVNNSACLSLGYSSNELCAMSVLDIDPSLTWEKFVDSKRVAGFSGSLTFETVHRRKDGTTFPVEITVSNMEFHGKSTGFTFVRDITGQKRAIAELELTQFYVNRASIGIHRISEEGNIVFANEVTCRSLGYTPEELCSMTVFDIDPTFNLEKFREHRRITRAAGSRTFETIHRRKDGSTFPVEVTVNYLEYQDKEFSVSFAKDITERKGAEEALRESRAKYQAIVDTFDGLIYICSQDYRIEFMNRKLIERTGRGAVGEYCYEVMHDRDSVCPWCVNDRVFAGETIHWDMFSPKDKRWYEVLNVPIHHADGSMSKHSMMVDINDRILSEKELQRQKKLLEELNDTLEKRVEEEVAKNREKDIMLIQQNRQAALGEMLDHIAHQWKQPLNSISLTIQALEETASDGELTDELVEEAVSEIMALLDHMAQTIDIFRGFYRPDKQKKVFNIKDSIDQALAFIAPAFRFHSIAVELDVDPGLTGIRLSKGICTGAAQHSGQRERCFQSKSNGKTEGNHKVF